MKIRLSRRTHARRNVRFTTSVEALEARNLLSTGPTTAPPVLAPPTLTAFEEVVVKELDAYVAGHPGSLAKVEAARQALQTALNNPATSKLVKPFDKAALDVVDQVLIDQGVGGGRQIID